MDNKTIYTIEGIIGYTFKNKALLTQAFTRKSYANEHGGEHNEVLEFFGDTVVGFVTVDYMSNRYGNMPKTGYFVCKKDQDGLTKEKEEYVSRPNLSKRMRELALDKYIIASEGDIKSGAVSEDSVLEDTFEALVAAMYIDDNKDLDDIKERVVKLLGLDRDYNAILLNQIDELYFELFGERLPDVDREISLWEGEYGFAFGLRISGYYAMPMSFSGETEEEALLKALDALKALKKYDSVKYLENLTFDESNAINVLQELSQKKLVQGVDYEFKEIVKENEILWKCVAKCTDTALSKNFLSVNGDKFDNVPEYGTKKDAKKCAANWMLQKVLFGLTPYIDMHTIYHTASRVQTDSEDPEFNAALEYVRNTPEEEYGITDFFENSKWSYATCIRILDKFRGRK